MKKFNFSKKHKNDNSENNRKKIFNKINNIEIKPQFLVIGLVVIITVISLIYFIFLKYSPVMNFKYEGYGVSGKQITENLLGASSSSENLQDSNLGEEKNVSLAKIEEQGTIFKKLNSYFIGNKEKTEIDLNYPIYINDKNTIYNLNQDITLISKNFEPIAGYPNISITDGKVYNGNSLERADSKEYIFAKTTEGIYINLKEIKISTTANEYVLPVNSLIVFEENVIRYYSIQNNILVFNEIKDVDYNSYVIIKNVESNVVDTNAQNIQNEQNKENTNKVDKEYNYEELLTRLGIIENAKDTVEKEEIIEEDTSDDKKENNTENETDPNALQDQHQAEEQTNEKYIKPEVTVEDFKAEVYTVKSNLNIKDPKARIIEAPTFEIYKDEKIYLRRVFKNSGEIQITGLVPETEYEIIGKYIYLNAENKKVENTFYKGTIKTKGYEALGTIELSKEEGEIYSNKIQIKNVKIISDLQNEAIKGINQIELETGNIKTVLKNNKVNELLEGKEVTIESSEGLKSNTNIEYVIKFYDKNGKELKVKNNKGKTRTSKQEPKVTVKIKEQDIVSVTLGLKLINKDNVKLENYKYIITRPNGEKLKEERLSEHEKEIKLEDLDQNQYYKIKVYADYDLSDNKGIQKDVEIGNIVFATKPISTLGSLEMIVENKELTSKNAKISYKIDEDKTDKRLIQILNELTIKIVEVSQDFEVDVNEEGNNDETGSKEHKNKKVVYTNTLTKEEIEKLQLGETKEINYENLKSNTKYTIEITGNVELGNTKEEVPVTYIYKEFTTLKIPAKVEIKNQFVTGNLIDLDVRVEDEDNSVLNNKVRMELRDEKSNLIDLQEIETNKDWLRKTYEKLEENKTYKLSFYADQYNEGSTDETYKVNYLIKEIEIITEPGISGKIELRDLKRKGTGKNLIDVTSKINWRGSYFNVHNNYGKEYNKENNELKLYCKGDSGQGQEYWYDLSEYVGQTVTMSFSIKKDDKAKIYIASRNTKLKDITNEIDTNWKEYEYTTTIDKYGVLGFSVNSVNNKEAWMYLKDFQIELGNKKTKYEEFKYDLEASIKAEIVDKRNETEKYYIEKYENKELIEEKEYSKETITEEYFKVKSNNTYKFNLVIKRNNRKYIVGSQEFKTEDDKEIKGINSKEEYIETLNPEGDYIVFCDLDFRDVMPNNGSQYRFGNGIYGIKGKVDFNGHRLIKNTSSKSDLFSKIERDGLLENFILEVYLDNEIELNYYKGMSYQNFGTIKNFKITLEECTNKANMNINLLAESNYGIIENFILEANENLYGMRAITLGVRGNAGTIKNGYAYGRNIKAIYPYSNVSENRDSAVVNISNGGTVENIFSLANVDVENNIDKINIVGNIIAFSSRGNNKNIYSVGYGENIDRGPTIGSVNSNAKTENVYYFADKIFNNSFNQKNTPLALWDETFQKQILNSENSFNIELVKQGYYPHINWPNCMPKQTYIKLPEVEDKDLPDIVSMEVLESEHNTAKVKFSVNNPSAENITNIKIKNLECKIESQEYKDGKSEVIAILSNPIICVSKYSVISISTKGAYNQEYTREFNEKERLINIDFYREIYTTDEWKAINKSPTENYILMKNLDFKNNSNDAIISSNMTGIINGNNHVIKNIKSSSAHIFHSTINEVKDIKIENAELENCASWGGIFREVKKAVNVYADNIKIKSIIGNEDNTTHAGLISSAKGEIINCGINNVTIINNVGNSSRTRIGGLIAVANGAIIENCFATNVNIQTSNSTYEGVGGLIGASEVKSTIQNCYTTGKIEIEGDTVGGIIGYMTNYGKILNSYSYVDISGNTSKEGGVAGKVEQDSSVEKNIAIGNLYTSKLNTEPQRIVGSGIVTNINYAYANQRLNGIIKESREENVKLLKAEELLRKDTYINLGYNEAFDYSELGNNVLPKLHKINEDGSYSNEILPYQEDVYLDISNEFKIDSINIEKSAVNQIAGQIVVINTKELEVAGLEIEGMDVNVTDIITKDGKSYINITASPNKFYDTYKITKIKYNENSELKEQKVEGKIQVQFFKELYNFEDWQNIENGTYQNYKLMNDIDFYGKKDINANVTMARLEAVDGNKALKNVDLDFYNENNGFINEVSTNIENVNFENINIKNTKPGEKTGIIANLNGSIKNVNFDRIKVEAVEMNNIGIIGTSSSNLIENINMNNIIILGKDRTGGLIGNIIAGCTINNIYANAINITGNDYTGGIIGNVLGASTISRAQLGEVNIINAEVMGKNMTGGFIGYSFFKPESINKYVTIRDSRIIGKGDNVGGISGEAYNLHNTKAINIKVEGYGNNIGGISGQTNSNGSQVFDSYVTGKGTNSNNVGGSVGVLQYGLGGNRVVNTKVGTTGSNVGANVGLMKENISDIYAIDCNVEGYSSVGGNIGKVEKGYVRYAYNNSNVKAYENTAGGIVGDLDNTKMVANNNIISLYESYFAGDITSKANVGGLIGKIEKELYEPEKNYFSNYAEADLISEDINTISLGIGNMPNQNKYLNDTYFYKYSSINGRNPNKNNEIFIEEDKYLKEEELKNKETYVNKLKWKFSNWNYNLLKDDKYPTVATTVYVINLPKDEEHIINKNIFETENNLNGKDNINSEQEQIKTPKNIFKYLGKNIRNYDTYSEIESEDGSKVIRGDIRLYVKDGTLYALPVMIDVDRKKTNLVENNFIIDSYNGKEYETVLGEDGKLYDLKEPIEYPENFVNNGVVSIGNNLSSYANTDNESSDKKENLHEVEVIYKNGNKVRFNYQTGEVISSTEEKKGKTGLFDYMKEKISELGNLNSGELQEITNKYKESKILQNKIEEMSVEYALQIKNSNTNKVENTPIEQNNNMNKSDNVMIDKNDKANNSLKEPRYISIYNAEKDDYYIYQEEELLDTTKQEVVSENDKIEANNLKEYYASEGKSRNKNMGILWITLSIVGVVIILFAIKKRD